MFDVEYADFASDGQIIGCVDCLSISNSDPSRVQFIKNICALMSPEEQADFAQTHRRGGINFPTLAVFMKQVGYTIIRRSVIIGITTGETSEWTITPDKDNNKKRGNYYDV